MNPLYKRGLSTKTRVCFGGVQVNNPTASWTGINNISLG